MKQVRLTDAGIRRLKPGAREYTVRDAWMPSLCVRVQPSGTRTLVCLDRQGKRSLGPTTLLTVDEARRECLRMQSEDADRNVAAPAFSAFVAETWRAFWSSGCKPSTICRMDKTLNSQLLPAFGNLRMNRITPTHVHRWFDVYSRTSPGAANKALEALSQIFNHAVKLDHIKVNPAKGVKRNPRPKLSRFLSREEIDRLHMALDRHVGGTRGQQADIIRLLLLTGCRKNEIVRLRTREVDAECLRLADSKTGPRAVFLSREARDIVERRLATASGEFLFTSPRDPAKPISDTLSLWNAVRRECGFEDVRLHDLRHTYGSQAVMLGVPLPVVARLLGHSKVTMTLRYAHVADREVEAAAERVGVRISKCLGFPDRTANPN